MTTKPTSVPNLKMGQVKTFGPDGPIYEVIGNGQVSTNGEWLVPIRVIESGQEVNYPFSQFRADPEAH